MKGAQSGIDFIFMSWAHKVRDFLFPRSGVLQEVGIEPGFRVLDYGCGPGGYIVPLAALVGGSGEIYALDIQPLALEMVKKIAAEAGLSNVKTIRSACATGLPGGSFDVVLLYDILHHLRNWDEVLRELHRVLRGQGILSVSDHHMKEQAIILKLQAGGLFTLASKGRKTYSFRKA